jgi:hypothetical protein
VARRRHRRGRLLRNERTNERKRASSTRV